MVNSMKRILFVINQLGGGGAERVLTLLANNFSEKSEYEVSILAIHKTNNKYDISKRVNVIELDERSKSVYRIIKEIREQVKLKRAEIVISFEYHLNMKTLIATHGMPGVKVIVSERNDPKQKGGKIGYKQLRNCLYKKCDFLVCQTSDAKAYFPKSIQKKTKIILNPIESDLPEVWSGKRRKEVVNFCRLNPQKNLKLLIDAFREFANIYTDFHLTIYGNGELRDSLQQYINENNLEDKITLHPAIKNVHEKIKDSYMFVSSSDFEGLSNSMLEAMAMGIPTICTDCPCGGARMVINNKKNGILVPVQDKKALIDAMIWVVVNNDMAQKMAYEGSKIREKLHQDKIVQEWEELI